MANFFDRFNPFKNFQIGNFGDDETPPTSSQKVQIELPKKKEEKPFKKVISQNKLPQYDRREKITPAKLVKLAKIRKAREEEQLKFWPDGKLAAPGVILRSALFGVRVKREKRVNYERAVIASYGTSKIIYTGTQLDQNDLDVLLTLFDLQKRVKLGSQIEIQESQFLKMLGYTSNCQDNFNMVRNALARLKATCVEIHDGNMEYYGSLIGPVERDKKTGVLTFQFDLKILSIFNVSVRQDRTLRSLLCSDLAKWLYAYLCSHTSPHEVRIDTLKPLTGSKITKEADFRIKLKEALNELKAIDAVIEYCLNKKKDNNGPYWVLTVWKSLVPTSPPLVQDLTAK